MPFKASTKAADRIGSDLGVSYLLEGSVRTTTHRIGITARLIETETGVNSGPGSTSATSTTC